VGDSDDRRDVERLAEQVVPALIARLSASRLGELELRRGGWRVRLRRGQLDLPTDADPSEHSGSRRMSRRRESDPARGLGQAGRVGTSGNGSRPILAAGGPGRDSSPAGTGGESRRSVASAPAVGYYLPRDGIGIGQTVRAGDVLGHIDVLGVRQEIVAPTDGVIARLLAEPGEAVEYGQELVRLDALSPSAEPSQRRRPSAAGEA
jgi:biotin carboxyl carrier protein